MPSMGKPSLDKYNAISVVMWYLWRRKRDAWEGESLLPEESGQNSCIEEVESNSSLTTRIKDVSK